MMEDIFNEVIDIINKGKRFIVVTHVNPDGDALGSLFGLALSLKEMGKEVITFTEEPIPEPYDFLPGAGDVVHSFKGVVAVDATFAVDCGQLNRLGDDFVAFKGRGTLVNIDHHRTNDNFGDINIVLPEASAAGEIVYDLVQAAGMRLTKGAATNMYIAIHTDTGSFHYSSTSAASLRKAADMVEAGVDPWEVSAKVYENYPLERFVLLGMVLNTLELFEDNKVAVLHVSLEMFEKSKAKKELSDGFVNYARSIKGVEAGVLFRETAPGEYKISMRSKKGVDVSAVAEVFDGGGHMNAAGAAMKGNFDKVKRRLLAELKKAL